MNLADAATLPRVAIDPAELREVLLNLLFNAADAMPDGGRIDIATRPGRKPRTADLEVRDTGQGMPESVRARIFEPFFSTKGPKGSGLGLAVAYSIITRHGGEHRGRVARRRRHDVHHSSALRAFGVPGLDCRIDAARRSRPNERKNPAVAPTATSPTP